eukprot:6203128-Prymnesium_polylepis.1
MRQEPAALVGLLVITFWVGLLYGRGVAPTTPHATASAPHMTASSITASASHRTSSAIPPASPPAEPLSEQADAPFILLGVITSPMSFERRQMLREFAALSGGEAGGVQTEYVVGDSFFDQPPSTAQQAALAAEVAEHQDIVFVNGRERLPHVGKATEKSAAWWSSAPRRSAARVYCKTDDD